MVGTPVIYSKATNNDSECLIMLDVLPLHDFVVAFHYSVMDNNV